MKKIAFSIVAFGLTSAIAYQLLGEATVYFEMHSTGATSRAELADDFGLGILWLLFVLPGSIVIGFIGGWLTWLKVNVRKSSKDDIT